MTNKEKMAKKELEEKMDMFSRLPGQCLSCLSPFDKTDKEMVMTWTVIVKEKEQKVNLYCPGCWGKARQVVEDYYKEKGEKNEQ